uniref:Balbiani ring protein 3-like n=1 Tax=Syphacia muris TaxID=451379 RepID=A0A0N5ADA6_9BILA
MCNCKPDLINCKCVFQNKDSRKCTCSRKLAESQQSQQRRYCRCADSNDALWNYCKNSCQERCYESCLNSDAGLKCLEQCGILCFDACLEVTQKQNAQSIQLVVQNRSQCKSGCTKSCFLSCKNQEPGNRPICERACQDTCQKTCNSVAPDESAVIDYDMCRSSCLRSCRNSCLSQPGQNLLVDECGAECKRTCDQVCSIKQNRQIIAMMMASRPPPEIFLPDQLSRNTVTARTNALNIPNTDTKREDFNNCLKHCLKLRTGMRYSLISSGNFPVVCYETCSEMKPLTEDLKLSGCRASCPTSCNEYCEKRQIQEQDNCKTECNKACALACEAEIINVLLQKIKKLKENVERIQQDAVPVKTSSAPLSSHPIPKAEVKNKKSKLRTKINIFPHNRTAILQCQIRCARYCVENFGGDQCISDCQQSCLEAEIAKAGENHLVTTINIGEVQKDNRKPQILPCKLGAKPTGENCNCVDGYTQCGVNQCCRK